MGKIAESLSEGARLSRNGRVRLELPKSLAAGPLKICCAADAPLTVSQNRKQATAAMLLRFLDGVMLILQFPASRVPLNNNDAGEPSGGQALMSRNDHATRVTN